MPFSPPRVLLLEDTWVPGIVSSLWRSIFVVFAQIEHGGVIIVLVVLGGVIIVLVEEHYRHLEG